MAIVTLYLYSALHIIRFSPDPGSSVVANHTRRWVDVSETLDPEVGNGLSRDPALFLATPVMSCNGVAWAVRTQMPLTFS